MLQKLVATLVALAFAVSAFAQAQKATPAEPKGKTGVETQKATPAAPAKGEKKAKAKAEKKAKGQAKAEAKK